METDPLEREPLGKRDSSVMLKRLEAAPSGWRGHSPNHVGLAMAESRTVPPIWSSCATRSHVGSRRQNVEKASHWQ